LVILDFKPLRSDTCLRESILSIGLRPDFSLF
jgi:hypothetical protein